MPRTYTQALADVDAALARIEGRLAPSRPAVYNFTGGRWAFGRPAVQVSNGLTFPHKEQGRIDPDVPRFHQYVISAAESGGPLIFDELYLAGVAATNDQLLEVARWTRGVKQWHDVIGDRVRVAFWNYPGVVFYDSIARGPGDPIYDAWAKGIADYAEHPLSRETEILMPAIGRDTHAADLATWKRKVDAVLPAYRDAAAKTGQELVVSMSPHGDDGLKLAPPSLSDWRAQLTHLLDVHRVPVAVWLASRGPEWEPYVRVVREFTGEGR